MAFFPLHSKCDVGALHVDITNYRLTHSASELSGFTCTSSLTMNEKFQYRTSPPSAVLKISSSLLMNECR